METRLILCHPPPTAPRPLRLGRPAHRAAAHQTASNVLGRHDLASTVGRGKIAEGPRGRPCLVEDDRRLRPTAVVAAIAELHSYALPCALVLPITGGHTPYLSWLSSGLGGRSTVPVLMRTGTVERPPFLGGAAHFPRASLPLLGVLRGEHEGFPRARLLPSAS